jgi:hypothetical protein
MTNIKSMRFVALLLVAGCGKLGDDMTEAQFCKEYAKRECARVGAFCSFDAALCEPSRTTNCMAMAANSTSATRKFNPDRTDRCLDQVNKAYATLPIDAAKLNDLANACERVFEGTAKANQDCAIDYDCQGDLICDKGRCGTRRVVAAGGGCADIHEVCQPAPAAGDGDGLQRDPALRGRVPLHRHLRRAPGDRRHLRLRRRVQEPLLQSLSGPEFAEEVRPGPQLQRRLAVVHGIHVEAQ